MGIFSSIIGGAISSNIANKNNKSNLLAQHMANETNLKIAQMNNEYNEKMLDKQIAYNKEAYAQQFADTKAFTSEMFDKQKQNQWDMFNATNEYNSASAQRERLEQAGLNPYIMMSGGSAGSASAVGGSAGQYSSGQMQGIDTPTATPVSVNPVMSDNSGVRQSIQDTITNIMAERDLRNKSELNAQQVEQLRIENKYKSLQIMADIANKQEDTNNKSLQNFYQGILNRYAEDMQIADLGNRRQSLANLGLQHQLMEVEKLVAETNLQYLPEQLQANIAESWSRVMLNGSLRNKSEQEIKNLAAQVMETEERTTGMRIENKYKEKIQSELAKQAEYNTYKSEYESHRAYYNQGYDNPIQALHAGVRGFKARWKAASDAAKKAQKKTFHFPRVNLYNIGR